MVVMEKSAETGVGPKGKSMDTWSVCELVMDPPLTRPPVVALVWGLVSWATATAAAKPIEAP